MARPSSKGMPSSDSFCATNREVRCSRNPGSGDVENVLGYVEGFIRPTVDLGQYGGFGLLEIHSGSLLGGGCEESTLPYAKGMHSSAGFMPEAYAKARPCCGRAFWSG